MSEITNTVESTGAATTAADAGTQQPENDSAELARQKTDLARMKAALDKAAKEAADYKKQLRAHQTAEEAAAEEAKIRQAEIEKELEDLRHEKAVATTSKRFMSFISDEKTSNALAEALYGAADIDQAVDAISKAWEIREKALKKEYGQVPTPAIGSVDGPTVTKEQFASMGYKERLEFHNAHPDEYKQLVGR